LLAPKDPKLYLGVFISPDSVQLVPSQSSLSVFEEGPSVPPAAIADVCIPILDIAYLAVFRSFTSVQLEPSHDSVLATLPGLFPP
jgi:hypothetical protein